jgi:alpha-methylacyl-CoA racemase
MSVGAIEPQFYEQLLKGLQLDGVDQYDNFEENKALFEKVFAAKTQKEWCDIFDQSDACVFPVLDWKNAPQHPHNQQREAFVSADKAAGNVVPQPAPRLSRTPGVSGVLRDRQNEVEMLSEIFAEIGLDRDRVEKLIEAKVILVNDSCSKSKL